MEVVTRKGKEQHSYRIFGVNFLITPVRDHKQYKLAMMQLVLTSIMIGLFDVMIVYGVSTLAATFSTIIGSTFVILVTIFLFAVFVAIVLLLGGMLYAEGMELMNYAFEKAGIR